MKVMYKLLAFLLVLGQVVTPLTTVSASELDEPITAVSGAKAGDQVSSESGSSEAVNASSSSQLRPNSDDKSGISSEESNRIGKSQVMSEKSENVKGLTDSVTSSSEKKNVKNQFKSTDTSQSKVAEAHVGQDIAQYLPDDAHGTIIDNADIKFTDKNGQVVDQKDVNVDTNVSLHYNWSIPNELQDGYSLKGGDYFTFKLPENVTYTAGSGPLGDYGTYTITGDGTVRFTFNDNVNDESYIAGDFYYNQGKIDANEPGDADVMVPTKLGAVKVSVTINPIGGQDISKSGVLDKNTNATGVTWQVDVNTSQKVLNKATLDETMPESVTIKGTTVYVLQMDLRGNVQSQGAQLQAGVDYTVDAQGDIHFIGAYANTQHAFRVIYHTIINQDAKPVDGGNLKITNTAMLENAGQESETKATVNPNYGKMIDKRFEQVNQGQQLKWYIDYNLGEKALTPDQATLTDTLDKNSSYLLDSLKLVEVGGPTLNRGTDYTVAVDQATNTMTIKFPNGLQKGVYVTYNTQYDAPLPDGASQTVTNEAHGDGATTGEKTGKISPVGVDKHINMIDYVNKFVKWEVHFNQDQQKFHDLSLADTMGKGLTFVNETNHPFEVWDENLNKTLPANAYTVTQDGQSFTVKFTDQLTKTDPEHNHKYRIMYWTAVDYDDMVNGQFDNAVAYEWTDTNNQTHQNKQKYPFVPTNNVKNDGVKGGDYNAVTKEITWSVGVNFQGRQLKDAQIIDKMKDGQRYVADSAKLYLVKSINDNGQYELGTEVANVKAVFDEQTQTLTAQLPATDKMYVLVYKTSLDGLMIQRSYTNTADFINGGETKSLDAQVSVRNGDETLSKTGKQSTADSSLVDWTLTLNASQSLIKDAEITDTPSNNQTIYLDSIKIQQVGVNKDGSLTGQPAAGSEPLVLDKDYRVTAQADGGFTITFLHDINNAYLVTYSALIDSDKTQDVVSNSVSLTGNNKKDISGEKSSNTTVVNNGGSASGANFSLVVTKEDADTAVTLSDATFTLTKKNSGTFKEQQTTNAQGQLTFDKLKAGTYYLTETKAPLGYLLDTDPVTIMIDKTHTVKNVAAYTAVDEAQKGAVILTKIDTDTKQGLGGAQFNLYRKADEQLISENIKTNADGQLQVNDLKPGAYYFVETKAPAGYVMNDERHEFEIGLQKQDVKPVTMTIANEAKTGSVILTKQSAEDGSVLAGAIFSLYNDADKELQSGLQTDADGQLRVDDLKPGAYYFVETKAPAGYDLNSAKQSFVVALQTETKVAEVMVTDEATTGSVVLTKTDADTHKVLANAIFSLYNQAGQAIKTGLTTDASGQIKVDGLKPGAYYFVETKAPAGYKLATDKSFDFEIALQTEAKVVSVAVTDEAKTGSVILTKTDADTNQPLAGAIFSLYNNKDEELKTDLTTDEAGEIKVTGLKPGAYYFKETQAPAGYDFDDKKAYNFTVALQTESKVATTSATNVEKPGSVVLTKFDSDTKQILAGAEFSLYNKAGVIVKTGLVTNESGQIKVDGLKPGHYYFVETKAPAGYDLPTKHSRHGFNVKLQTTATLATVKAFNAEATGSVVLTKTDADTNNVLASAVFSLYNKTGEELKTGLVTNEAGQIKVDGLKPGEYYFKETKAPAGYDLSNKHSKFTIALQTEAQVAMVTAANEQTTGSVVLTKTDADTQNVLAGATFSLYNVAGDELQTGLITDKAGQLKVDGLKPGHYYFMETKAPAGYAFDADKQYDFVVALQTETKVATVAVKNAEITGSVILTKTDADTNAVLANAEFSLYNQAGKQLQTGLMTNEAGQIKVDGLKPGAYYFMETKAPAGYDLDANQAYNFTVALQTVAQVAVVTATNTQTAGAVILTKTDADTGAVLAGATFSLYSQADQELQTDLITNAAGQIKIDGLKPGAYYFVETQAPAGYDLEVDKQYDFTIALQTETKVATTSVTNVQKPGSVVLTKFDSDTKQVLADAEFSLYNQAGQIVKTDLVTNQAGQVKVDGLKPGAYYFVETKAPAGYELDTKHLPVTITLQKTVHLAEVQAFNAEKTGSVELTKRDADTQAVLANASFSLYNAAGKQLQTGLKTAANGQLKVNDLKPGDYYFVETKAPLGYDLDVRKHKFTVALQTTTKVAAITVTNVKTSGSVVLTKHDADTGAVLAGAEFNLYNQAGKQLQTGLKTDVNGQLMVSDLKPGDYYFVETKAPAGYDLDADQHYKFKVALQAVPQIARVAVNDAQTTGSVILTKTDADTNAVLANAEFSLYNQAGKQLKTGLKTDASGQLKVDGLKPGNYYFIETKAPAGYDLDGHNHQYNFSVALQTVAQVAVVTATNIKTAGSVILTKTDADTGAVLAGATFDLYNQTGKQLKTGLQTDANGQLKVDGLKPGAYYFVETQAPAGYDLEADKQYDFTIALQTETKVATTSVTNVQKPGSVVLTKFDSDTKQVLADAGFSLYNQAGQIVKTDLVTNQAGQVKVDGLKPGTYYFVETKAPAGYELDTKHLPVTITLQKTVHLAEVQAFNTAITGSVELTKRDADTDAVLAGATFDLYNQTGKQLQIGLKTDVNGQLKVNDLKPGDYYFVETKAPAGYELEATSRVTFTIVRQSVGQVAKVTAINEAQTGSVILTKTAADTQQKLAGAVFSLYRTDGQLLRDNLHTSANGQLKVDGLKPGEYYFVETQAPLGYQLVADKQYHFTIAIQTVKQIATLSVTNAPLPVSTRVDTKIKTPTKINENSDSKVSAEKIIVHKREVNKIAAAITMDRSNGKENSQLPITGEANNVLASLLGLIILVFVASVIYYYNKKSN